MRPNFWLKLLWQALRARQSLFGYQAHSSVDFSTSSIASWMLRSGVYSWTTSTFSALLGYQQRQGPLINSCNTIFMVLFIFVRNQDSLSSNGDAFKIHPLHPSTEYLCRCSVYPGTSTIYHTIKPTLLGRSSGHTKHTLQQETSPHPSKPPTTVQPHLQQNRTAQSKQGECQSMNH